MPTQKVVTVNGQDLLELDLTLGQVIQVVSGTVNAVSGTTQIPFDNTAPLITEGFQLLSLSVTPKAVASKQYLTLNLNVDHSNNNRIITATVWVNTSLIYTHSVNIADTLIAPSGRPLSLPIHAWFDSVDLTPKTVQVRVGANGNGTTYVGASADVNLGGNRNTHYSLMEVLNV